ncbi:MAG: biotin/lipoyl-containing protein [Candidatus Bathyarchaeales archaeon]
MFLVKDQMISVGGRSRHVRLAKTDRPTFFVCEVDDKKYGVEVTSKLDHNDQTFIVKVDGKHYRIKLCQGEGEQFTVEVDDKSFVLKPEVAAKKAVREEVLQTLAIKEAVIKRPLDKGAIIASMPGRVVAVKVKRGDRVKAGDVVCILEAMKMENEILAPRAGAVQEVNVLEGASVERGQVLIRLKPL